MLERCGPLMVFPYRGYTEVGMAIWKVMKWLLIAVGGLIGLMLLVMSVAVVAAMIDDEDTFYVRHAQFVNSNYLSEIEALRCIGSSNALFGQSGG